MDTTARSRYSSPRTRPILINRPRGTPASAPPPRLCFRRGASSGLRLTPLVRFEWGRVLLSPSRR